MAKPLDEQLRVLYERLLQLADKEEQAITADNLGELEACMRRKGEIFQEIREIDGRRGQNGSPETSDGVAGLLAEVAARHERVTERIKEMLGDCRQAILQIQMGKRAHRAYYRARKRRLESLTRLL